MASEPGRGISLERWLRSTSLNTESGGFSLRYKPALGASKTHKLYIPTGQFSPPIIAQVPDCGVCEVREGTSSMFTLLVGVLPDEDGLLVVHTGSVPYSCNQERIFDDTPDDLRTSELVTAITRAAEFQQKVLRSQRTQAISRCSRTDFIPKQTAYRADVC